MNGSTGRKTWGRELIPLARLREILERHRGKVRAILSRDLAMLLGLREKDGRSIREAVNALIDHGHPVGSSTTDGASGYFWVTTEEELQACVANYQARARENQRKAEALIEAFRKGPKQTGLFG